MSKEIIDSNDGLWVPDKESVASGLVFAEERSIIRHETRRSLLTAAAGLLITPLGEWQRRVYTRVFQEEAKLLLEELEEKGLIWEHQLVQSSVIREKISKSHGEFSGSLFSISGSYVSETKPQSKILFAWQTKNGAVVLSETETRKIELIFEDKEIPTVEFEFDASKLISQPVYAGGALVRKSFRHPNGYLNNSLVTITLKGKSPEHINQFLLASENKDQKSYS